MRARITFAVVLALVAGLLVWRSGAGAGRLRYYNPERYVERADAFIRKGYLQASCQADRPSIEEHFQDASDADRSWYEESYLAEDVRRFNRDPASYGWTFVVDDDCRLRGVNPTVHKVELPFAESIRWIGSLFYRGGGSQAALRSAERSITLRRPDTPVRASLEGTTRVGAGEGLREQGAVLLHFAGGPGQPAARLSHVGEEVVLHNQVRRGQPEATRLLGLQLPVGRLARLESGDWLHLAAEAPVRHEETFVFVGGEALESASRVRLQNDRYERTTDDPGLGRVTDPVADRTSPYLELVAGSISAALAALPEPAARQLASGFDVQLTLDREVQLRLSETFRGYCLDLRRRRPGERVFTAGMTVLDGVTGDVLALATYPSEDDLTGAPVDDDDRRRLLRNQNLVLHPIGSAGKPFFFTAIAHAFPFLTTLVIDPYPETPARRDVLQCEILKGYRVEHGHGAPVDFRTALQISSNPYTVELAALALAAERGGDAASGPLQSLLPADPEVVWPRPGRPSGIQVAGQALDYAPALGFVHPRQDSPTAPDSTAARRCLSLGGFDQVGFRVPLEALTGADTYWGADPQGMGSGATRGDLDRAYRTGRYDLRPWLPLLEHLFAPADDEQRWKIRAATQEMSPERVNLAFNQVSRLREDFISLLLGGGTSLWTNVQLTEALSRLVTGRAVEARMATRVLPRTADGSSAPPEEPRRALAPELPIRAEARRAVLEGLERVGRPGGGTAPVMDAAVTRHLRQRFPADRIDLYSKTGSPVIEYPVPRQAAAALAELVGRSRLRLSRAGLVVALGSGPVPYSPPGEPGRGDFERAVARALAEVGYPRPSRWLVSVETELLDELAEQLEEGDPEAIEGPIRVEGGVLALDRQDKLFRQRLATGKGAVYIFSLVRRPGGAGAGPPTPADFESPDARVVTVAIHFTIGPDAGIAVEAARAVLPHLAPLLE